MRGICVAHIMSDLNALMACLWRVCWRVLARSRPIGSFSKDPVQLSALRWVWPYGFDPAETLRCSKSLPELDTSAGGNLGPIYVADCLALTRMPGIVASVIQVLADLLVTLRFVAYGQ